MQGCSLTKTPSPGAARLGPTKGVYGAYAKWEQLVGDIFKKDKLATSWGDALFRPFLAPEKRGASSPQGAARTGRLRYGTYI